MKELIQESRIIFVKHVVTMNSIFSWVLNSLADIKYLYGNYFFTGKGFGTPHNLEVHNIVHTGYKPFICRTCGKVCIFGIVN